MSRQVDDLIPPQGKARKTLVMAVFPSRPNDAGREKPWRTLSMIFAAASFIPETRTDPNRTISTHLTELPQWVTWIVNLLNAHTIRLKDDHNLYLFQMGAEGENPNSTPFAPPQACQCNRERHENNRCLGARPLRRSNAPELSGPFALAG